MKIEIESNIPMPQSRHSLTGIVSVARELEIGQSFAVPWKGENTQAAVMSSVRHASLPDGRKFTSRKMTGESGTVIRVWRTA